MTHDRLVRSLVFVACALALTSGAAAQVPSCPTTVRDDWITVRPSGPLPSGNPSIVAEIPSERIVPIPSSTRDEAIRMLEAMALRRLGNEELERLFPQQKPDGDAQASAAISRYASEAERRERESKIEFFKNDPRFAKWAEEARAKAQRERAVRGHLIAYLARGVLANPSGRFYASISGNELSIMNGSLGCVSMIKAPVVVFVDREITDLVVSVSSAF